MIDVHSHIIPSVDDGSKSVKETFQMIEEAEKVGFTDIIMTPHYLTNYYETDSTEITFWTKKIEEILKQKKIDINIYSGMEIYVSNKIKELIKNKTVIPLANSRYILIELPLSSKIKYVDEILFEINSFNLIPIIAHPERYKYLQENPELINELIDKRCLIQCNYGSILDLYGKAAKKTLKFFLKNNYVDFLGTDCHVCESIYPTIPKALEKLEKLIGKEELYKLTTANPSRILNDEEW